MSTRERVRRPVPARTHPVRSWAILFGAPEASRGDGERLAGVDEYIRQGERAARTFGGGSYGTDTPLRDVQDLTARLGQYAQDFFGVWMQLLDLAVAGTTLRRSGVPTNSNGAPHPPAPAAGPSPGPDPVRLRIEVTSARPVEVVLDLRPEAAGAALIVHDLRAAAADVPRLTDVVLEPGDPPRLRLRVPDDQPAAVYHGVVIDERGNRAVGTVTVQVAQ
jgi:hypothetical protein